MGIQINGSSDIISAADGSLTISGADLTSLTQVAVSGVSTFSQVSFGSTINVRIGDTNTGCSLTSGTNNNFLGASAGRCNTTGSNNNFFGFAAGCCNTTGFYNNFFGSRAGCSNTTGSSNNFFGAFAGLHNTGGSYNNFFGNQAGCCNTTGGCNFFGGYNAGRCNTTGCFNNFLGVNAGRCNTTGNSNNFFGSNAGRYNTTGGHNNFLGVAAGCCNNGSYNNFFGRYAGRYNTTGCHNNFFGNQAGLCNTTGCFNNFFGRNAGCCNTTGTHNFFGGYAAGRSNTTGNYNNFFGREAGRNTTTGSCNTFLGRYAGCNNTTGSHNIAIGNNAQLASATGSCQLVIGSAGVNWIYGNSSGNLGIGIASPAVKTHISDSTSSVGVTGTEILRVANTRLNTGTSAVAIRLVNNEIAGENQYARAQIAAELDTPGTNDNTGRLMFATANSSGTLVERVRITSDGNVGIGITNPGTKLEVQGGQFRIRASGTYSDPADNVGVIAYDSTSGDLNISARSNGGNTAIAFRTSNSGTGGERVRITSTGNVGIGTDNPGAKLHVSGGNIKVDSGYGIDFSAASNASGMTSELLNDYEEGTWTPTTVSGGWSGFNIVRAVYTKIGRLVTINLYVDNFTGSGNASDLVIGGLPFTSVLYGYATGIVDFGGGGIKGAYARVGSNDSLIEFFYSSENTGSSRISLKGNQIGNYYIIFTLTYTV